MWFDEIEDIISPQDVDEYDTIKSVTNFINARFKGTGEVANWLNGNCYYFACILKARFPEGKIVYDVIEGHFLLKLDGLLFDYNGLNTDYGRRLVNWDEFDQYDSRQKQVIIRDCIR